MRWWQLLLFLSVVWCLCVVAAVTGIRLKDALDPLPDGSRRGDSSCAMIPIPVMAFWGAAKFTDLFVDPWGTIVVASVHAAFAVALIASIVRDRWRLMRHRRRRV